MPTKVIQSSYRFSSSHVWIWELDYKESWVPKNWFELWCWRRLESPLDCKEIQPDHPKGNQSWIFIGRTGVEAGTPILCHLMQRTDSLEKSLLLEKIESRGWDGWMASLIQWAWVWVDSGSWWWTGNLACCSPWCHRESDMTELNYLTNSLFP